MTKKKKIEQEQIEDKKRVQLTFTLKEGVRKKFNYFCKVNFTNKSHLVESLIERYLDQNPFEYPEAKK